MWKHRAGAASLEDFIEEGCYVLESHRCNVTGLYKAYEAYCKRSHTPALDKKRFAYALKGHGFKKRRSGRTGSWEWHGLAPIDPGPEDQGGGAKG